MAERTPSTPNPVSDLLLERYALGELPRERLRELEGRLASEPELRARLESLRASNEALLREHSPETMARRLQDRLRRERIEEELRREGAPESATAAKKTPGRFGPLFGSWGRPAFAGALFLALVSVPVWQTWKGMGGSSVIDESSGTLRGTEPAPVPASEGAAGVSSVPEKANTPRAPGVPGEGESRPRVAAAEPPSDTRSKGLGPALALFRRTDRGAEALQPGAVVRAGDELRVGYRAGGFPYGAIFSVDGNGSVTRHWPPTGDSAGRLEPGEPLLPDAFRLDAAPDYERFYLLLSEKPFPLRPVLESLHAGKLPGARDQGLRAVRFDLLKDNGS